MAKYKNKDIEFEWNTNEEFEQIKIIAIELNKYYRREYNNNRKKNE